MNAFDLPKIRPISEDAIRDAAAAVREGKVIAFPTDTVYGLGCDPFNQEAVRKVIAAKKRGSTPLPVLVDSIDQARRIGELQGDSERLAHAFWPGALTLVVRAKSKLPEEITGSSGTVGLRVPNRSDLLSLIRLSKGALVGTSANCSGKPSAQTAADVERELGHAVDMILDGGRANRGVESTVVSVDSRGVHILREKAITQDEIFRALRGTKP